MSTLVPWRLLVRSSADLAWGGVGVSMATASAGFAAYMIATAPAQVTGFGSKDFKIFVQFDRRPQTVAATHGPPGPPPLVMPAPLAEALPASTPAATASLAGRDIDATPTGSIPGRTGPSPNPRANAPLAEYRLRDVFGDHALIEYRSKLTLVAPGSMLAGAGQVLSIERQGKGWVVKTASGMIGGS